MAHRPSLSERFELYMEEHPGIRRGFKCAAAVVILGLATKVGLKFYDEGEFSSPPNYSQRMAIKNPLITQMQSQPTLESLATTNQGSLTTPIQESYEFGGVKFNYLQSTNSL